MRFPYESAWLITANKWAAIFHGGLTVVALVLGVALDPPFDFKVDKMWPVVDVPPAARNPVCNGTTYVADEVFDWLECIRPEVDAWRKGVELYAPTRVPQFAIKVWVLLFLFELLTAGMHALLAWRIPDQYLQLVEQRLQPFRWAEYSVTASIMLMCICSLSRVSDMFLLASLFLNSAFMNLTGGMAFEVLAYAQRRGRLIALVSIAKWVMFAMSWLSFVAVFWTTFDAFYSVIQPYLEVPAAPLWDELFWFIKVLNWTLFGAFFSFPAVHLYQPFGGDYARAEGAYIVFSFLSKGALVLIIYAAAVMRPEEA